MYYEKINDDGQYATRGLAVILSHETNSLNCYDEFYSYHFRIYLSINDHYDAAVWCEENCQYKWLIGCDTSAFEYEEDAIAFKLRWM